MGNQECGDTSFVERSVHFCGDMRSIVSGNSGIWAGAVVDHVVRPTCLYNKNMVLESLSRLLQRRGKDHDVAETSNKIPTEISNTPFYEARRQNQLLSVKEAQSLPTGNEQWSFFRDGDYSFNTVMFDQIGLDLAELIPPKNGITLSGNDRVLAALVIDALQKAQPIRITDIGGMAGYSWMHLARYFQEFVEKGLVEFVVTNLHYSPDELVTKVQAALPMVDPDDNARQEHYQSIIKGTELVRFVQASTDQLAEVVGPSDLLFESNSATYHSATPGRERWNIAATLKSGGLYITDNALHPFTSDRYQEIGKAAGPRSKATAEAIQAARRQELEAANTVLESSSAFQVSNRVDVLNSTVEFSRGYYVIKRVSEET